MKRPHKLTAQIKVCDPDLRLYIIELEKENRKLSKQKMPEQNKITFSTECRQKPRKIVVNEVKLFQPEKTKTKPPKVVVNPIICKENK